MQRLSRLTVEQLAVVGDGVLGEGDDVRIAVALYLPATVAMRRNPPLRAFAERLRARGKCPKVVIAAVMRKLLLLAWSILRSGQPFSPTHHFPLAYT